MRLRTLLTYLSLLPLSACTRCKAYDNNEEFARAQLPAYTETGANTLGCVLGPQTWTVLGSSLEPRHYGSAWSPNSLIINGPYFITGPNARQPLVEVHGRMTGVRDSKAFYDTDVELAFTLTDTLGGLHLLGADSVRYPPRAEYLAAGSFIDGRGFVSSTRHPVRLLVRKLNRQQRIVSGTFSGMLYQHSGSDSLAVRDGRFDVKY